MEGIEPRSSPLKEVSRETVNHAHGRHTRKKWDYGRTFAIGSHHEPDRYRKDAAEVLLRVECGSDGFVFYGLAAFEGAGDERRRLLSSEAPPLFE